VVSVDPPEVSAAFRTGLGATFPFLSDKDKTAIEQLDIVNISKGHDNVPGRGAIAIPYSFSLMPDFTVHNIYNGYWFFGRPAVEDIRQDLRQILKKCRPDYDLQQGK